MATPEGEHLSEPDYTIDMESPVPGTDMELLARRELAMTATDAISEVLEVEVSVRALVTLSKATEASSVRLAAKRALRCIESIARDKSAVVKAVGDNGIYHYVEGVISFGADEDTYLELMNRNRLNAEQTTGLYALREKIAEETNGQVIGFPTLHKALSQIGFPVQEASFNTDEALTALYEAGYIIDHLGPRNFDRPIFMMKRELRDALGRGTATPPTPDEEIEWFRAYLRDAGHEEEIL